jgi:hypothetical protein
MTDNGQRTPVRQIKYRLLHLMGTPIIPAANVYEAPKLLKEGATLGPMAILSGVVAGIVAYLSLLFLMRYFHRNEFRPQPLRPLLLGGRRPVPGDHRARLSFESLLLRQGRSILRCRGRGDARVGVA